jgi:phosphoribosylformimino-5-aminoimidazole carboxamide ribotide isomerase
LTGKNQIVNYKILQIASKTKLKIDFGGGLKSDADLKLLLKVVLTKLQCERFSKMDCRICSDKIILEQMQITKSSRFRMVEESDEDLILYTRISS